MLRELRRRGSGYPPILDDPVRNRSRPRCTHHAAVQWSWDMVPLCEAVNRMFLKVGRSRFSTSLGVPYWG
jgi:hypothetical protein